MECLHNSLQVVLRDKFGFPFLTPIQQLVLEKNPKLQKDLLISSPTGSGKSLAYLIPIVNELVDSTRTEGTHALIITPTRELSVQLETVSSKFSRKLPHFVCGALLSGSSRQKEKARLRSGVSIVIGAPGRLADHLEKTSSWNLTKLKWVVIEEADRYLYDKNAKETLKTLLSLIDSKRNRTGWKLVLVSATLPKRLSEIGGFPLSSDSVLISLAKEKSHAIRQPLPHDVEPVKEEQCMQKTSNLNQWITTIPTKYRLAALLSLFSRWKGTGSNIGNGIQANPLVESKNIKKKPHIQSILFVSTCDTVEFLYSLLTSLVDRNSVEERNGKLAAGEGGRARQEPASKNTAPSSKNYPQSKSPPCTDINHNALLNTKIFKLHGSQTSTQRAHVIEEFRKFSSSESFLLITTSVGARGLDFPQLQLVLQWDAPLDLSEYKHKIGRTARWQGSGDAVLLLMPNEEEPIRSALCLSSASDDCDEKICPQNLKIDQSFSVKDEEDNTAFDKRSECYKWISIIDSTIYSGSNENRKTPNHDICTREMTLLDKAKKAFIASLRAYATYPISIRRAGVHPKKLHLGHYAKSFGLRETPGEVGSLSVIYGGNPSSQGTKSERAAIERKAAFRAGVKRPLPSEFSAS